jgi:thioesterase domain-containing protein
VLLRDAVPYHAREAALLPEGARVPYLRREARVRVGRRIPEPIQRARAASRVKRGRPKTSVRPADPASRAIRRAYLNYTSETIDLHVHEYVTDSSQRRAGGDPSLYWAPFFRGGFTVRHVPGKHFSMFDEPHINVLAATLERDLRAAEAPPAPPATGSEPSG